jgi:hypothetical protein
MKASDT